MKTERRYWKLIKLKEIIHRYEGYIRDFGLNIIASVILTFTTSLIVNPIMAARYTDEKYGTILTVCGVAGVLSSAFGNTLNNVKLINKNHEKENYNFLITCVSVLSFAVMIAISLLFYNINFATSIFLGIHALLITTNSYYTVTYRIKIDYIQNLKYNVLISAAYILGLIISFYWDMWPCIYICADVAGFIYLYKTSVLFKEPFAITRKIGGIFKKYIPLILTSFLGQVLLYFDRFIIYPLVGSGAVAIYSVASFFGKSIGLVMAPIASVLLSYYADEKKKIGRKAFWQINYIVGGCSIVFVFFSFVFAPFFTRLIYPTLFDAARPYLYSANIASIINIMGTMTNPFILKFCDMKWQMYITIIYGLTYAVLGFVMINLWGLWGFAMASIMANAVRLLVMYIIGSLADVKK